MTSCKPIVGQPLRAWSSLRGKTLTPKPPKGWFVAWILPKVILDTIDVAGWIYVIKDIQEIESMLKTKVKKICRDQNGVRYIIIDPSFVENISLTQGEIMATLECECGGKCIESEHQELACISFLSKWWKKATMSDKIEMVQCAPVSAAFALVDSISVNEKNPDAISVGANMIADFGSEGLQ